jgi:hypothetical protein
MDATADKKKWRRLFYVVALVLGAIASGAGCDKSSTGKYKIAPDSEIGCTTQEGLVRLTKYLYGGGTESERDAVARSLLIEKMWTVFKKGEVVYLVNSTSTLVQLRREGAEDAYWTDKLAIRKK